MIAALTMLFFVTVAIMFSAGSRTSPATEFFGRNLYLVKSNSFDLIRPPSIVTGEKIDPAELGAGDIVIFKNPADNKRKLIGQIVDVKKAVLPEEDGEPALAEPGGTEEQGGQGEPETGAQAGRIFIIDSEFGDDYSVGESDIISKAMRTSRFFGFLVNFAISPGGLLLIAVIPCVAVIASELFKSIYGKIRKPKEVPTIKKQDEVPTFVPKNSANNSKKEPEMNGKSAVALKAYRQTLNINNAAESKKEKEATSANAPTLVPELFISSSEKPKSFERIENPNSNSTLKKKPLSSAKLAEAIATVKLGIEPEPLEELSAAEKARRIREAMQAVKGEQK